MSKDPKMEPPAEPQSLGELVQVMAGLDLKPDPERRHFLAMCETARKARATRGAAGMFTGSKPIFKSGSEFLKACLEYFVWCEENPMMEVVKKYDGNTQEWVETKVPRMRIKTVAGLCNYLAITDITLMNYRRERFPEICKFIDDAIREEREVGGANGMLNAGFIARLIGLSDRKEFTGKDGAPLIPATKIDVSDMGDEAIVALTDKLNAAKENSNE